MPFKYHIATRCHTRLSANPGIHRVFPVVSAIPLAAAELASIGADSQHRAVF
ncbi:hypothetical protein [Pseudomonas sp. Seg1]|uniref:hypothetical protein n=1 Tax=Pseudomonas sp. Seg1 TaxID=2678259 RepID=UPI001BB3CB37|nr:hypothetical protein [Pseudomonas sp. Seg1]